VTTGEMQVMFHDPVEGQPVDPNMMTPVQNGVRLPIHFGNQGLAMVVLGVATNAFTAPVAIEIELEVNGRPLSSLQLEQLSFTLSRDGMDYLANLFVAFDGCEFFDAGSPG